jgi:hypothetical protein
MEGEGAESFAATRRVRHFRPESHEVALVAESLPFDCNCPAHCYSRNVVAAQPGDNAHRRRVGKGGRGAEIYVLALIRRAHAIAGSERVAVGTAG